MYIAAMDSCELESLPSERDLCSRSRCFCVFDFAAKYPLEVLRQHTGRTSVYDLSDFWREANTAQIREATNSREEHIDDEPFDIIICAPRHNKMCNETWIARRSLQRVERARCCRH